MDVRTTSKVVVVIDDLADIGPVEEAIVRLTAVGDPSIHIISTETGEAPLVDDEGLPAPVPLLSLMARLADRLVPVTGEIADRADESVLRRQIRMRCPQQVYVAVAPRTVDRLLGRDLGSRLRRVLDVEVMPLPAT